MNRSTTFVPTVWACHGSQHKSSSKSNPPQSHNLSRRRICKSLLAALALSGESINKVRAEQSPEQQSKLLKPVGKYLSDLQKSTVAAIIERDVVKYGRLFEDRKRKLFASITEGSTVLDVGIGCGPNIPYMPKNVQLIGVDPNEFMQPYAEKRASSTGTNLKFLIGQSEMLPLPDSSCDAAISTFTLCTVEDPARAIQEILRVLKPGGKLFFIEHVLAGADRPLLRGAQNIFNPLQILLVGGCHLNRDTLTYLKNAVDPGFSEVDCEEFEMLTGSFDDNLVLSRTIIIGSAPKLLV